MLRAYAHAKAYLRNEAIIIGRYAKHEKQTHFRPASSISCHPQPRGLFGKIDIIPMLSLYNLKRGRRYSKNQHLRETTRIFNTSLYTSHNDAALVTHRSAAVEQRTCNGVICIGDCHSDADKNHTGKM